MSPDLPRLLIALLTGRSTGPGPELDDESWDGLISLAIEQRMGPMLHQRLTESGLGRAVPESARRRLARRYRSNALASLRLQADLHRIGARLQAAKIPFIVLKGMHVANSVYPRPALREMVDIDLLLPEDRLDETTQLLLGDGYEPFMPAEPGPNSSAPHHLPRFLKPKSSGIEIHWHIDGSKHGENIDVEGLWSRTQTLPIAHLHVRVLSPEDLILYLAWHLAYGHRFEFDLRPLFDIRFAVAHHGEAIQWGLLERRAEEWGGSPGIYLALQLANELADASVPDQSLVRMCPDNFDEEMVEIAREHLFIETGYSYSLAPDLAQMWNKKDIGSRLSILLSRIFPAREEMALTYHLTPGSPRLIAAYLSRFLKLPLRHGPLAWRLRRGDPQVTRLARQKSILVDWLFE